VVLLCDRAAPVGDVASLTRMSWTVTWCLWHRGWARGNPVNPAGNPVHPVYSFLSGPV